MQHLDEGLIHELLDGEIPSDRLGPIQTHLAECEGCQALLDTEREMLDESKRLIEALDEQVGSVVAPRPEILPKVESRPLAVQWSRRLAWAASLVLAVGLGYAAGDGWMKSAPELQDVGVAESRVEDVSPNSTLTNLQVEPQAPPQETPAISPPPKQLAEPPSANAGSVASAPASPEDAVANAERKVDRATEAGRSDLADEVGQEAVNGLASQRSESVRRQVAAIREGLGVTAQVSESASGDALAANKAIPVSQLNGERETLGIPAGPLWVLGEMHPFRTDYTGDEIRLIYHHPSGRVELVQRRVGLQMGWRLMVEKGFPADSLAALKERVR